MCRVQVSQVIHLLPETVPLLLALRKQPGKGRHIGIVITDTVKLGIVQRPVEKTLVAFQALNAFTVCREALPSLLLDTGLSGGQFLFVTLTGIQLIQRLTGIADNGQKRRLCPIPLRPIIVRQRRLYNAKYCTAPSRPPMVARDSLKRVSPLI